MMRICLLLSILFSIGSVVELHAQTIPTRQRGPGFRLSDNSAFSRLTPQANRVTPASFLNGKEDLPPLKSSKDSRQSVIPSILTGKKQPTSPRKTASTKTQSIDPLNIPSAPIGKQATSSNQPATNQVGTNQNTQPNTFTPPVNTKPAAVPNGQFKASGVQATNQQAPNVSSAFQSRPSSAASGTNKPNTNSVAPRIASSTNRIKTPTFDQVRTAEARNTGIRSASTNSTTNAISNAKTLPTNFSSQKLSPQIKVTSIGPKSLSVNKSGKYEVKISNIGTVDANEVMIGIEIPAWIEIVGNPVASGGVAEAKTFEGGKGVVWSVTYLPAGRDAVVSIDLMPKENRAFNLKTEWTTAPVSSEAKVMVTQPNLLTSIAGPAEVKYGEKAVYKITIENAGNGPAEKVAVSLSDSLGGDSANVGNIGSGATKQFEVELTAGQAGPLKLEAFVSGDAGVKSEIAKEIVVRRAKLAVVANGPKFKYAGSAVTYNVTVENTGDAPAKNITAASLLPVGAEYISGLTQVTENDGRKIGWKIGEIPANSKRDFILTCLIKQAGEARMEFGVRSADGLTAGNIVTTTVEALADLTLQVVDPRGPQAVGRDVVYELHIKNRGTKAANNVLISGEFSDSIDPIAGKGARATIKGDGVISFAPIRMINVGESVVLKVVANATGPGTHTFRAIVECKAQDIRRVSEGTTKFFGEQLKSSPRAPRASSSLSNGSISNSKQTSSSQTTSKQSTSKQLSSGNTTSLEPQRLTPNSNAPTSFAPANTSAPSLTAPTATGASGGSTTFSPPSNTAPPAGGSFQLKGQ